MSVSEWWDTPTTRAPDLADVRYDGQTYPARRHTRGAAYELFSSEQSEGFESDGRADRPAPYHRFVPAIDTDQVGASDDGELPPLVPVAPQLPWRVLHRISQDPRATGPRRALLDWVRDTVRVVTGTRMVRLLTAAQVAGMLRGSLALRGFCYREYDVAHLRTPEALRTLTGTQRTPRLAYLLRWRAVGPEDYQPVAGPAFADAAGLPASLRLGPPILGTGFAPSEHELICEFVTADLADLPLTVRAEIVACTPDGEQVTLFEYLPEHDGWSRMVGARRAELLTELPDIAPDQDFHLAGNPGTSRLFGQYRGKLQEAVADPPHEYRLRSRTRAARFPVETLSRFTPVTTYRGLPMTIAGGDDRQVRLRARTLTPDVLRLPGLICVERGIYELRVPATTIAEDQHDVVAYPLP